MKRCPECRRDYYDDTLLYCLDDGNSLLEGPASMDEPATAILSESRALATGLSPTEGVTRLQKAEPGNSIAVLPFANISNDPENEYFCDGLAEELLNALSKIGGLKVAARTSAFSFKGRKVDVGQIASVLSVKTVLEGSVRKSGNKLRITVQLINASDGYHLWSERYDREMKDIFATQDEITLAVVNALKVKLLGDGRSTKKAENIVAYEFYLKGKYHLAKLTPPDMEKSLEYFQKAIELDESYAQAYVGLADAYMRISIAGELPSKEFFPKSKAAANKAIEIDEGLAEAYVARAWIAFWYDWNWNESERYCRRALELDANSPDAHLVYAHFLSNSGRHDEALAEISLAKELDPLSLFVGAMEGQFLLHAGRTDEALDVLLKLAELEANFWLTHLFAASAFIEMQMFSEATVEARKANQLINGSTQAAAFEAYALAGIGQQEDAETLLSEAVQLTLIKYVPPYHLALLYHAVGNLDDTYKYLERGIEERDVKMMFLKVDPKWKGLRNDSRFKNLLLIIGFPD